MTDPAIERCRAEQRAAAAHLQEHPDDHQGQLWLNDWIMEELLLLFGDVRVEGAALVPVEDHK